MTAYAGRPSQVSKGVDSRIVHKGSAGFEENLKRLVELLLTPISSVFVAARKDFATITFESDVMARVTLAGMVDTTSPGRFSTSSIEDLHVAFRTLFNTGAATRAQASSELDYDIDLTLSEVEYRMRFSVIAIL